MLDFAQARRTMVDCQLRTFDVTDRAVLDAAEQIPRERFMPAGRDGLAYLDQNVPLAARGGTERYMLQPMVLARLIQALQIRPRAKVLDVASGLGYASAFLARLGASVVALESDAALAADSRKRLRDAGFGEEVEVREGALDRGCPDLSAFDAILVNGTLETRPDLLLDQLAAEGRLACLRSDGRAVHAMLYVRGGEGVGSRILFDASAPLLREFRAAPAFVF